MKRKTGQNFLIDKKVAEREVEHACIEKNDVVLEIGPGKGTLTTLLAERAQKVVAIEIDNNLFSELREFLPENVELIHGDALKIDFETLPKFNKIVSNLPFQISSPITFKFLNSVFSLAILIYQKEFADRMIAKPGSKNYSRLSVAVHYKAQCELIEIISKVDNIESALDKKYLDIKHEIAYNTKDVPAGALIILDHAIKDLEGTSDLIEDCADMLRSIVLL